ncbi:MAG TPA: phosphate signaling complex protein PhoU [Syntrophorhabdales bacterium]|nr:phosphate signaling complex protein PhoU [Syntrophorhabdales bacterium]
MLEEKMKDIKRELMEFSALVRNMVEKSIEGLLKKQKHVLVDVIEKDEPKANDWEITLDELCIQTIAQYTPRAKDLRTILMALRMNNDLERMGDHAVNIAEDALFLAERPQVKPLLDIPRMAEESSGMVRDSLLSFVQEDAALAKSVCERDNIVDAFEKQVLRELITYMTADPATIERGIHLLSIARNLERIADLSTNIGEDVIFMVEGRVIKHHRDES